MLEAEGLELVRGRQGAGARRRARARARRARRARRPERIRQDDAARDAARRAGRRRGAIKLGHGVQPAYFSQHDVELDERGSVLSCAMSMTGLQRPQAQPLLGRFLFSGWDEHEKPVTVLSGGERRRLALAVVVASGANLLVLDEPTNHLDLESREALEAALEAFPGRSCSSRTTAPSSTPSPTGRSRSRSRHCARTTAAGPISCAPEPRRASAAADGQTARVSAPRSRSRRRRNLAGAPRADRAGAGRDPDRGARAPHRALEAALAADWTDMDTLTRIVPPATSCRRCSPAGRSCSLPSRAGTEAGASRLGRQATSKPQAERPGCR